jgi:hypothetical protein
MLLALARSVAEILKNDAAGTTGDQYERADGWAEAGPQPVNEQ